jgi:hypothetical protein
MITEERCARGMYSINTYRLGTKEMFLYLLTAPLFRKKAIETGQRKSSWHRATLTTLIQGLVSENTPTIDDYM